MLIVLRFIHVVCGVFWAGSAIFNAAFLLPSVRAVGPAAGPVMRQIGEVRKVPLVFMITGLLTILAGIGLYSISSGGFRNTWMSSGPGIAFAIGGACAIIGFLVGFFMVSPAAMRAGKLAASLQTAGKPPTPEQAAEMQRLQMRMGKGSALAAGLLALATMAMAVARYV